MSAADRSPGTIIGVNGPIVRASGMRSASMLDVVEVGGHGLIGEIIRLDEDVATIQVYENTTGLQPGDTVHGTGAPLSVRLGPGLIGNVYDGIQRPLRGLREKSGVFIRRGEKVSPLDEEKKWGFTPLVKIGDDVESGQIIGTVQESRMIEHRVLVPPSMRGGVTMIAEEGEYTINDVICRLSQKRQTVELTLCHNWPARKARPAREQKDLVAPLFTGQRVIDSLFPISKGGTAAIPGGFGTGKTMTQQALAKFCDADIIIYIGCGERGNEMTDVLLGFPELVDPRSGLPLMERTILIANTSNMPVAAREVCIYTGITMAEYYRDMGYAVAIMADSTSRWAEALRELSGRLEEMPADEGFPAYLPSRLAEFYERAGRYEALSGKEGSITVVGAVSPPGGDFSEPVTQNTKRFIRCFWALDRDLADARHYPAISWLNSYSEYAADLREWWADADPNWASHRDEAIDILQKEEKLQQIVKLVGPDALPDTERLVLFAADLLKQAFLQQNAFDEVDKYCEPKKQAAMLGIILDVYHAGKELIEGGVALEQIRRQEVIQKVMRMKSTIPNDALDKFSDLARQVQRELVSPEAKQP
ncbi:MAG: V-type ATP synthase subunit A [Planctomycetes bacterium]|nr:V-type ATP synthase subunit A [Planctomycetota bacterium]